MSETLSIVLSLLALIALTAGTGLFVAAEFSLSALERSTVDTHVQQVGDRRAHQVQRAHRTLSFQLSGAQLGITITTLATGYIAEPAIARLAGPLLQWLGLPESASFVLAVALAIVLANVLSMLFGELVPKNLAIARPLPVARATAGLQSGFSRLFRWVITGLNGAANWIVRRFGVEPVEELRSARSPHELGSLVRSSAVHGTLDATTADLLDRSLRFGDRTADEVMTPRVQIHALRSNANIVDLVDLSRRTGFSRFPVHSGDLDDVIGIVHVKQAFGVPLAERVTTTVAALARPVPTVPDTLPADALLDRVRASGLQVALVVDEYGGTAGLVTMEDLVEEIVGDVRDEHDRGERNPIRSLGAKSWLVSGLLRGDEIAEATGFQPPDGDYETIAGFVLSRFGRIPRVGDELRHDGWLLTVMRMDKNRVAELRVTQLSVSLGEEATHE